MNDQPGWYENLTHRVDFLGHTEPRRNDELHEYLKRGGKLSDYAREMAEAGACARTPDEFLAGDALLNSGNSRLHPCDPNARFDRALGLTPQMEKAS